MLKFLIVCVALLGITVNSSAQDLADRIVVSKNERLMSLYQGDKLLKTYKISLGPNPVGHKQQEGDGKTPEGDYIISWHNPRSSFHKALRISYPNSQDVENAKKRGVSAGGNIMIHGFPNTSPNFLFKFIHRNWDWTAGCIAVTDEEIDEIWDMVKDGTPIKINP